MQTKLEQLKEKCLCELSKVGSVSELNALKQKYTGKSGEISMLMRTLKDATSEERPRLGKLINDTRDAIISAIEKKEETLSLEELEAVLSQEKIDITLPAIKQNTGALHPLSIVTNQIISIFLTLGYSVDSGREIETDYYNFEALNIPSDHPARDTQDTFYFSDNVLLRTQTSNSQIHRMEKRDLPIKMISPGRTYRSDDIDATHSPMFHQLEGLVVDKNISMRDLKGTLDYFAKNFFGKNTKTRLRPSFFPFTEPSIEVDATCSQCAGKGCRVCKGGGWIEIMGAGMVNNKVLENCGIDSSIYSGFAFGMGLDRITNIKYGITDLRVVFENDIQFLKQFK